MTKYTKIAKMLERRIKHGDYTSGNLPSEYELAEETDVSRSTARRALLKLLDEGLVVRKDNGRIAVNPWAHREKCPRLAFLAPAYQSSNTESWRIAAERVANGMNVSLRPIEYVHWDDPIIRETLEAYEGVLLMSSAEDLPDNTGRLLHEKGRVVSLDRDLSDEGVPSLRPFAPESAQLLLRHLYDLGHRHIGCFNTQPHDAEVEGRIEQWRLWTRAHKVQAELIDEPVKPYGDARAHARSTLRKLIQGKGKGIEATALFCTTMATAAGAMRGLRELGRWAGGNLSICSMNGEGWEEYLEPTLTCLNIPDLEPYLGMCMEWMLSGEEWNGSILIQPADLSVFEGDSTGVPEHEYSQATAALASA